MYVVVFFFCVVGFYLGYDFDVLLVYDFGKFFDCVGVGVGNYVGQKFDDFDLVVEVVVDLCEFEVDYVVVYVQYLGWYWVGYDQCVG